MEAPDDEAHPTTLSAAQLARLLGTDVDMIRSRQALEHWRKPGRGIERVTWAPDPHGAPRVACVKYGARLEKEALAYTALLDPAHHQVPHLIGHRPLPDGGHAVATEWLPGRQPDFWTAGDVVPVFAAVGRFTAVWADRLRASLPSGTGLPRRQVPVLLSPAWQDLLTNVRRAEWYEGQLREHVASILQREQLLQQHIGGSQAVATCREIGHLAARLAHRICSVPLTLDPGDFGDENALLGTDGTAYLLDFENCRIAPVVQWFMSVGEDWTSVPALALVDLALRAFLDAWNATGCIPLDWDQFRGAHHCLRVHRKCVELQLHLRDVANGVSTYDARDYAVGCARDLPDLLHAAVATLESG